MNESCYGVAAISRLLKIIGLFGRILSLLGSFSKGTYNFKEPTSHSHPIFMISFARDTHMNVMYIYIYVYVCVCLDLSVAV